MWTCGSSFLTYNCPNFCRGKRYTWQWKLLECPLWLLVLLFFSLDAIDWKRISTWAIYPLVCSTSSITIWFIDYTLGTFWLSCWHRGINKIIQLRLGFSPLISKHNDLKKKRVYLSMWTWGRCTTRVWKNY